jgi:hypothetical protein
VNDFAQAAGALQEVLVLAGNLFSEKYPDPEGRVAGMVQPRIEAELRDVSKVVRLQLFSICFPSR